MQANATHSEAAEQPAPIGSLCELVVRLYDTAIAEFEGAAEAADRNVHGAVDRPMELNP